MDTNSFPTDQFFNKVQINRKEDFFSKEFFLFPKEYSQYIDKVVLPKGIIHDRLEKLAESILVDNHNQEVVFLVLLRGGVVFAQSLFEKISSLMKSNAYCMKYRFEYISVTRIGIENVKGRSFKIVKGEKSYYSGRPS